MDVRRALALVGLNTAVNQLPQGLQSVLQSGGFPLSALQANRLMLARAIVSNPSLLIVDGTLDAFGDSDFTALMKTLRQDDRAVLIFTHVPEIAHLATNCVSLGNMEYRGSPRGLN
jgi:putative ABC transport system ATP-binding protein